MQNIAKLVSTLLSCLMRSTLRLTGIIEGFGALEVHLPLLLLSLLLII